MTSLFEEAVTVMAEDIDKLTHPPEDFLLWVWSMFVADADRKDKRLDKMVQAVLRANQAETVTAALQYLCEVTEQYVRPSRITYTDLSGRGNGRALKRLSNFLMAGSPAAIASNIIRRLGCLSHQAVPEVLAGQLPSADIIACLRQETAGVAKQISLFDALGGRDNAQLDFLARGSAQAGQRYLDCFGPDGRFRRAYLSALRAVVQEAGQALMAGNDYLCQYTHASRYLPELYELLTPVYGGYVRELRACHQVGGTPFLDLLTLLAWGSAVLYSQTAGRFYFAREIRLLPPAYGSFGQTDAVRVCAVAGKTPDQLSEKQRQDLAGILSVRSRSVGQILQILRQNFGDDLTLEIADWKFSVGDARQPDAIIKPSEVATGPLLEHRAQVQRYLVLASLDHHLARRAESGQEIWSESDYFRQGALYYFLPGREEPLVHRVVMAPSEQKEVFQQIVVRRWPKAQQRAIVRTITNGLVGHLLTLLGGNGNSHAPRPSERQSQSLVAVPGLLEQIIARHRVYFDRQEIIEIVGRSRQGEPILGMHLDRLFAAINQGKLTVGQFTAERGGFIRCLAPDHDDHNPSMHVSLTAGIFKCFSCGVFGHLLGAVGSEPVIPEVRSRPLVWGKKPQLRTLVIPAEHDAIMSQAQSWFQAMFWDSAAEEYLVKERRLKADLCHALGAGLGHPGVINRLLDEGYTYEQLIHYGFVGISSKVSPERSLRSLFYRRGMMEVKVEVGKKDGKPRWGWPYFPLDNRVTWPLTLGGKMTNFYGRATWPCERQFAHRKLSVEHTGLPHGAFNLVRAEEPGDEVYVTEAAIDAITLEMLGFTPAVAVIGANNVTILERMATLGKKRIVLAFDADETGRKSAWLARSRLYQAGFTGEVVDLSRQFFTLRPPASDDCKDYNRWLQLGVTEHKLPLK